MFLRASEIRPDDYQAPGFLSQAYTAMGRHEDAVKARIRRFELVEKHLELNPDDARALVMGGVALATAGQVDRALELAGRALALDPEDPMILYNVSCTYAVAGRTDAALSALQKAVDNGFGHKEWVEHDTDLDSLRDDPRFQSLASAM